MSVKLVAIAQSQRNTPYPAVLVNTKIRQEKPRTPIVLIVNVACTAMEHLIRVELTSKQPSAIS